MISYHKTFIAVCMKQNAYLSVILRKLYVCCIKSSPNAALLFTVLFQNLKFFSLEYYKLTLSIQCLPIMPICQKISEYCLLDPVSFSEHNMVPVRPINIKIYLSYMWRYRPGARLHFLKTTDMIQQKWHSLSVIKGH